MPVSGGASVGEFPFETYEKLQAGFQYCNEMLETDSLSLLFLKARDPKMVRFGCSYESSWGPVAPPVICTKAEKNLVIEVDQTPILEYLKTYLGEGFADHIFFARPKFSFIARLKDQGEEKSLIRVPFALNSERQGVDFWPPEDMQGQKIQLVQLSRNDLLCRAENAARSLKESLKGYHPEIIFRFDCTVRSTILHIQGK